MQSKNTKYDVKAYLQLIRAPGLFSIVSNIFASSLIFHWLAGDSQLFVFPEFLLLLLISILCYQAGMITNDVADIVEDSSERPFRPIPSGRIKKSTAIIFSTTFSLSALGFAGAYSWSLFLGTLSLLISIFSYNFLTKSTVFGAINMAGIRLLNWLLVAALYSQFSLIFVNICFMVFFYTLLITVISRYETTIFPEKIKTTLYCAVIFMAIVWIIGLKQQVFSLTSSVLLVIFLAWLTVSIYQFIAINQSDIQSWVTILLKNMVLLDALLLFACGLYGYAILCLSLILLSKKTAQYVYLT